MKLGNNARQKVVQMPVAFTPKGGCPLKLPVNKNPLIPVFDPVAFTPKGGCPLKREDLTKTEIVYLGASSIHPQGWVPIETRRRRYAARKSHAVAFTPKGGC